ncbi:protease inhibitor I42 family protein [Streptomyces sp. SS1-1]|uniref:protease inhibitor I42 family protein n=1 Tax=unclassified Streptomyces TaxID=2593676 RepID=UPI00124FFB2D|nr:MULTISPECIES: protease inhibitor I42 family protein [unclassified Streptomyces]KAB2975756.1 protease inhibitor I42 family protein [Streptomyces sp. SS1-1]MDI9830146.1 protease inhibitor I42 family protein [Streptomyces sp. KAU_LT]
MTSTLRRLALPALLTTVLAGCGDPGPDTYELGENRIQVDVGEEFTLSVPVDTAMGEWWYTTTPEPDPDVVRRTDKREEIEADDDAVGSGSGTDLFDFKAVGPGTTRIRLIQCPRGACAGGGSAGGPVTPSPVPSGSPTPGEKYRATIHTYTVTVRTS